MKITKGKIEGAQKVIIYGPEGIGKSTLAAQFPDPVFIDTEGSTKKLDVARTEKPSSWTMLMEQVRYFKGNKEFKTLVIDTGDWAEQLCIQGICSKSQKSGIEDFGYGKGYTYLAEEFGRLLNLLEEIVEFGMNVVITAHAVMRKFEQPDELGAYDRWELKLQKKTAPLVKEWADMVLFANYETSVVNVDGQGSHKGKNKAQGGRRVMYTSHHPCWDAKNRDSLPEKLPLEYEAIAHLFPADTVKVSEPAEPVPAPQTSEPGPAVLGEKEPEADTTATVSEPTEKEPDPSAVEKPVGAAFISSDIPKPLRDLMEKHAVDEWTLQTVVAQRGYYPEDTPIKNYDPGFIQGVLVGAWDQVYRMIQELREEIPF